MPDPDKIYEQRSNEFRSLNGFLWQIPVIMMTLNGGLWFSVASLDLTAKGQSFILTFAGIANLAMTAALIRLRFVMAGLLAKILTHEGVSPPKKWGLIVGAFSLIMLVAAGGAFWVARDPGSVFAKTKKGESTPAATIVTESLCPAIASPTPAPVTPSAGKSG